MQSNEGWVWPEAEIAGVMERGDSQSLIRVYMHSPDFDPALPHRVPVSPMCSSFRLDILTEELALREGNPLTPC